jgi:hypothetical protein
MFYINKYTSKSSDARCILFVKINNYLITQYQNSIHSFVFSVYTEVKYKKNIQLKLKNLFTKDAVVRYFFNQV